MTFLYPIGLLGLIGIPILIIIYIIKSKYMEQTISSTYKRKNPISKLAGLISLILQILVIAVISLSIAHPIISIPDSANEYCFILDASGSMNMEQNGETRFERGKSKIANKIDEATNGSVYSLIYVGDTVSVIYERTDNKEVAKLLLDELKPVHNDTDTGEALKIAQRYFNENSSLKAYYFTDKEVITSENVKVENVAKNETNASVKELTYTLANGKLSVVGSAVSYIDSVPLTFNLYVNGAEEASASQIFLINQKPTSFNLSCEGVDEISQIKVEIQEKDGLVLDNEIVAYNQKSESTYKTLLVSDEPLFIRYAVEAILNTKIDVLKSSEYNSSVRGYGLYIFDSVEINELPKDGAVWLFNIENSIEKSGFSVYGKNQLSTGVELEVTRDTSTTAKKLMNGMVGKGLYVAGDYVKYGTYRSFTTLMSHKGNPLIFVGANDYGNRQAVFGFDLNNTNIPLSGDYIALIKNLIDYSFPEVIEKNSFHCGDELEINVLPNCESIKVESPLDNVTYLDTSSTIAKLKLTEVGGYTVTMQIGDTTREINIYSAMNEKESEPISLEKEISLNGEATEGGFDGKYDPIIILFIVLAVVFLADWMVYCYEKCKLR